MVGRVAVIGAGGIGKHHAKWWALEGAEVCALAGTSTSSVAATRQELADLFGFEGRGYVDVAEMLAEEKPDFVDVCSPGPCHAAHVRMALDAGCHVLCEKPFVYARGRSAAELMEEAGALVALAGARGLDLGVCTQYSVAAPLFRRLWEEHQPSMSIIEYHGRLEAPAKGRGADPERIWLDLSPHLLAVILALFPDARLDWKTLETDFDGYSAEARFTLDCPAQSPPTRHCEERVPERRGNLACTKPLAGGDCRGRGASLATTRSAALTTPGRGLELGTGNRCVRCRLRTRNRTEAPANIRQIRLNGYLFDIQGGNDTSGVYCARIVTPDGEVEEADMMRLTIRDSLARKPAVVGAAILRNLEWMLRILKQGIA